ncbi:MAG: hypothetical protein ACE5GN_00165 [Waddliaceae bacterium]
MKYHVRKRGPILGIAILFATTYVLYAKCFSSAEKEAYQEVLARANPSSSLETKKAYQAKQLRKGVRKNFWYKKGDKRLEIIITGDKAEMVFEKQGGDQEIVEYMTGVKCYLQEELYFVNPDGSKETGDAQKMPAQSVRYLEADTARYYYTTEILEADRAKMILFTAPGHQLVPSVEQVKPVMDGFAEKVKISLVDKALNVKTDKFKGNLFQ